MSQEICLPDWVEYPGVPFSLECRHCDAGVDVRSMAQAKALGWHEVAYDDGPGWSYLGMCPECHRREIDEGWMTSE